MRKPLPTHLPDEDIIFQTHFVVPKGLVKRVDYAIYVVPEGYFSLETQEDRYALGRMVGRLNAALKQKSFICLARGAGEAPTQTWAYQ